MYQLTWQKPLKVGKRDLYTIDLLSWSDKEDILTVYPSVKNNLVSIETGVIATNRSGDKSVVGVVLTGLSNGLEEVELEYTTATRSDSVKINLIVGDTCLN